MSRVIVEEYTDNSTGEIWVRIKWNNHGSESIMLKSDWVKSYSYQQMNLITV